MHTLVAYHSKLMKQIFGIVGDKAFFMSGIYHRKKVRFINVKNIPQIPFQTFRQCYREFYVTWLIDI